MVGPGIYSQLPRCQEGRKTNPTYSLNLAFDLTWNSVCSFLASKTLLLFNLITLRHFDARWKLMYFSWIGDLVIGLFVFSADGSSVNVFLSTLAILPCLDSPLKRKKKENERKKRKKKNPTWLVTCSQALNFELISTHHLFLEILRYFILWKEKKEGIWKIIQTEEISLPFPDRYLLSSHSVRSKERLGWIAAVLKGRRAAVQAGSEEEGTRMGEGTGQVYEDEMVVHLGQYLRGEKNQPSAEASTGDRPAGQGRQVSECRHSQCRLWLWVALTR